MAHAPSSALFSPYRTIGLVCDGAQPCLYTLGKESFFSAGIGKSFQVYRCDHLTLSLVSVAVSHDITHIASFRESTFTATAVGIVVWHRAKPAFTLRWDDGGSSAATTPCPGKVVSLLLIGDYLMSLHEDAVLRVWDAKLCFDKARARFTTSAAGAAAPARDDALLNEVALPKGTVPTALMHPHTYLNKVAVGTASGQVLIVNIRTGKTLYTATINAGVAITAMAQSNVVDVVGIGCADGKVIIHNLKADARVCSFEHAAADAAAASGAVTAVAFSFDNTLAYPTLVTATESGALALWNLDEKTLVSLTPIAHGAAITFAAWLPGQPCILTAGADNALQVWQVDKLDGQPRLLRSRSGHMAPPRSIRYYGGTVSSLASGASATACEVVSAGGDRALRYFHTALDRQNVELSQGPLASKAREIGVHPNALRLAPITAIAASDRRYGHWADVVTLHAGDPKAYTWSWEKKKLLDTVLPVPGDAGETATAVAISTCGSFAIVGGSTGTIAKYNLQSGALRGLYPKDGTGSATVATTGSKAAKRSKTLTEAAPLPAPDRDTGKGTPNAAFFALKQVDSVGNSLLKIMGVAPAGSALAAAAAGASTAAAASRYAAATAAAEASSAGGAARAAGDDGETPLAAIDIARGRHTSSVNGLVVDGMNSTLVSCDGDGNVCFWDFASHAYKGSMQLPSPPTGAFIHKDANLVAFPCDDFTVVVVDIATRRVARTFRGHRNRITDVAFSPDARWLVTSSLDRSVRVWDLPTARCIDWMTFTTAPASVAFSPTSEFLLTSHIDQLGISMWANKAHFGGATAARSSTATAAAAGDAATALSLADAAVSVREPVRMDLPGASAAEERRLRAQEDGVDVAAADEDDEASEASDSDSDATGSTDIDLAPSGAGRRSAKRARVEETTGASLTAATSGKDATGAPLAKPACRITLSGLPPSSWANLSKLDAIAARNKPKEAPKKPEAAPFFLPTAAGINPTFIAPPTASAAAAPTAAGAASGKPAAAPVDADEDEGSWDAKWEDDDGDADADGDDAPARSGSRIVSSGVRVKGHMLASSGMRTARTALASLLREAEAAGSASTTALVARGDADAPVDAYGAISAHLASQPPAAVDAEVRSLCLGPEDDDGMQLLHALLRFFAVALARGGRFDLTQAQLQLVLSVYREVIAATPSLQAEVQAVRAAHDKDAQRLRALLDRGLCMVNMLLGQ